MRELIAAIRAGDVDQVRVILQASIGLAGSCDVIALICAIENGHEGVVQILLDAGAGPNSVILSQALICASKHGHEGAMRLLLGDGAEVDLKDNHGQTALLVAAKHGQAGAVRLLLEAGAEVDLKDKYGMTALMYASKNGCDVAVRVLVKAGAEVDLKANDGASSIMYASSVGHEATVKVLLAAGAEVDSKNNEGLMALLVAGMHRHAGAIPMLLEAGATFDAKDNTGTKALMRAIWHVGVVRVLLEAGAEVYLKDNHRQTALLVAAKHGQAGAVRLLLEAGAALNEKSNYGFTGLRCAIHRGSLGVARVLLEAGAELPLLGPDDLGPDQVGMRQLLALHRDARAADAGRARREAAANAFFAAEAAATAAAEALLAEEEAEKSSAASRQAKAKRKKQRQKTQRAEVVSAPVQAGGGAHSGSAPSGADPPSHYSESQAAEADFATGFEEGQRTNAEGGLEVAARVGEGVVPACALQASDGADQRCGAEERDASIHEPLPVMTVSADEVIRALEAAGSDVEVGEGGFGKVVAAELPSLGARWGRVAVKSASGLQAADILLEVATLGLCSHRNVLPLLGYCYDARAPCMITPLMHGGSLDDRLQLSGGARVRLHRLGFEGDVRLNWKQRLSALCDAARGLAHLHCERILHRDVKTANILLESALRPLQMAHSPPLLVYRAVLGDVGLAKVREPTLGGTTHATTRNLAFSMGFGEPALLNSNQHSESTDAFGIGVCILMGLVSEPAAGLMNDHDVLRGRRLRGDGRRDWPAVWSGTRGRRLAVGRDPRAGGTGARAVDCNQEEAAAAARGARADGVPPGGWGRGGGGPCGGGWCVAAARPDSRRFDAGRARRRAGRSWRGFGTARGVVRRRTDADGAKARAG